MPLQHDLGARLPAREAPRPCAVHAFDAVILAQSLDARPVVGRVAEPNVLIETGKIKFGPKELRDDAFAVLAESFETPIPD